MPRYKVTIEYDGGAFCGWQRQHGLKTVQGAIEKAIFKFSGETVAITGAGRTDTGVHALGQVAHFDLQKSYDPGRVMAAINYYLDEKPIAILAAQEVPETFHARFSALQRSYRYRIINRVPPLVLERGRAWHLKSPLDIDRMAEAAQYFIGLHDFNSFRSIHCDSSTPLRRIDDAIVERYSAEEIHITIKSKAFLRNQVRIMVGSLKLVGQRRWRPSRIQEALIAADRVAAGPTAPPEGLYFMGVSY